MKGMNHYTIGDLVSNVFLVISIYDYIPTQHSGNSVAFSVFLYHLPRECTGQQPRAHSLWEYAIQVYEVML